MGNTQTKSHPGASAVWLAGLTIDDFLVPSAKTAVADVASVITEVVLSLESADSTDLQETLTVEAQETAYDINAVLEAWGTQSQDVADWQDRRVGWPFLQPSAYTPRATPAERIEDNLAAIRLLRELQSSKRTVSEQDRSTLLRYCGWGGLARIFSLDGETKANPWASQRDELKALTSEDEFEKMRSSVTSAFYTDPALVTGLWDIIRHLGFKGGRVLEPSAGVGHFLAGMPSDLALKSEITAVELDSVSADMLEAGFGPLGVQVHSSALEKAKLPVGFFDLVVGNVPFGNFKSLDSSSAPYANWSIHNWFFGKSIDLVRPGGLVVLITSAHTMDSETAAHREWLNAHAKLLGAFRLPTMAFKAQANTEVVTDVLVFQRREFPDYSGATWIGRAKAAKAMLVPGQSEYRYYQGRNSVREPWINAYYNHHPANVLGLLQWESTQYGEDLKPILNGTSEDLLNALSERVKTLQGDVYKAAEANDDDLPRSTFTRYSANGVVAPGSFVMRHGRLCVSEGTELLDVDDLYKGTARKRLMGMMEVREIAKQVIAFQAESDDDVELGRLQRMLNTQYDAFVAELGYLSMSANSRLMRGDPDFPLMLALEHWDEEEGKAEKADIFSKRTVGHRKVPDRVDNVKDAMLISLALYGKIVLQDVAVRTAMPVMQVVKELNRPGI